MARRVNKNALKTRNASVATSNITTSAVVTPATDKRRIPLVFLLTVVVAVAIACLLNPDWFSRTNALGANGDGAKETQQDPSLPDPPDPVFIVVAIVIPVAVIMSIVGYQAFVSGTLKEHIKRVSSYLGIVGLCVAAGGIVRLYPSSRNQVISSFLIGIGYLLGLYLVVKEFDLLPWDRKKKDDEEKKKKDRKKKIRASLIEWAKRQKAALDRETDLVRKRELVVNLEKELDLRILIAGQKEKEEQEEALLYKLRGAILAWKNDDAELGDKMWGSVEESFDGKK